MKFSLAILFALTAVAFAAPSTEVDAATSAAMAAADTCGAAGTCHGFGGSDLCNDRCQHCTGPSGPYHSGGCCNFLGQECCCYYDD